MKEKDGVIKLKELDDYNEYVHQINDVQYRLKIIEEERCGTLNELRELQKNPYKYSTAAIRKSKYWASDDFDVIRRIDEINGDCYIKFSESKKGEIDMHYTSSSVGILYKCSVPITEEKYKELYNKMKNAI